MEYGGAGIVHNSSALIGSLSEFKSVETAEGDFIDELLVEGCWLETTAGGSYNFMHPSCDSLALADPSPHHYLPLPASEMPDENFVAGKRWWIGPRANPGPSSSVKERLMVAVGYLREYTKNTNVLIQIWVPPAAAAAARRGLHLDYHYHHTINDHETLPAVGFPMSPTPNPNPNVNARFFRSHDYPRVHYEQAQQQQYDARGSLALPVFERGTGTCLGVLEILIANQHFFNYRPQLDNLCNALEAVDFRSCQNFVIPPAIKVYKESLKNHVPKFDTSQTEAETMIVFRCRNSMVQIVDREVGMEAAAFRSRLDMVGSLTVFDELYQAALNEIVEVLTSVCKAHNLPLALTWAPCIQQGKCGCGPSSSPDACCVSTVDSACFVADLDILGFQEACSECHLFRGQGIVGTAFTTTKPCFAIDITAFSKAEYPLAHHAKMFGLHAAVAIPLRSVYTGSSADFVLEFFLPKDCHDSEEQKHMLNSLSMLVQQACRSLHVAAEDELAWPVPPPPDDREEAHHHHHHHHHDDHHKLLFACPSSQPQPQPQPQRQMEEACSKESSSSWIAHMMEAQVQQKGKGVCVSLEYQLEEPKEEFKVTTNWDTIKEHGQVFSDFEHIEIEQSSVSGSGSGSGSGSRASAEGAGGEECYAFGGRRSSSASGGRKSGDKRRTKAEKTISLPVLRQYFAGSLKDAAKSIGVCPTTLKRICRQHGITRWPSRKIKKVGHSLKKLQLVIDSVQGAEGAIQIGSFYASFPELSSADCGRSDQSSKKVVHSGGSLYGNGNGDGGAAAANTLKSPPSACSQSTLGASAGNQLASTVMMNTMSGGGGDVAMTQEISCDAASLLNRSAHSAEAELQHASSAPIQLQDQATKHFTTTRSKTTHSQPPLSAWNSRDRGAFRVKATFVDEKIRFSLQPNWGIRDLQLEIARRFNLNDISNMDIKYLDDDGEWVLLACDADLEECKDIHRSSQSRTIRLSLFQASPLNLPNTFGSSSSPS